MFNKLYGHYKNSWSLEMKLKNANMTFDELEYKSQQEEEWL